MLNIVLYLLVIPLCIWACDSIDFNRFFKKNKPYHARVFYILLIFSLAYLIVSFLCDFIGVMS